MKLNFTKPARTQTPLTQEEFAKSHLKKVTRSFLMSQDFFHVEDEVKRLAPIRPGLQGDAHAQSYSAGFLHGLDQAFILIRDIALHAETAPREEGMSPRKDPDLQND